MASIQHPRTGQLSKDERQSPSVKPDMNRAVKLVQILKRVDMNGIDDLAPIIEAHVVAIDLDQLGNPPRRAQGADAKTSTISTSRTL
ncbi:hypothetical protein ACQR35_09600 [Pseudarthrobacter sp. J1738]|uniref:hypothetical protein n=1 Tax=Pseudarthrobacter sp. J1738 TaxID=3420446 RepID=UPI003D2B0C80